MIRSLWIIAIVVFVLAFTLRIYRFEDSAQFEWDQNRDYGEVTKISAGKMVTLGPVAKGEGGFYLGSLYYYVLYPFYFLLKGSLSSLPLTSLTLDAIFASLLYYLLHKKLGRQHAIIISLLWTTSWFMIGASKVSWNVALVPLWSLFTTFAMIKVIDDRSAKHLYIMGLLFGLSFHIHVAIIPVIPLLLFVFVRSYKFTLLDWCKAIILSMIPVTPLIIFDLSHGFFNLHLLRDQIAYQVAAKTALIPMMTMTMIKLGKVVSGILFSKFADNFVLGIIIIVLAVKSFLFDSRTYLRVAGLWIILATFLVIALHDYGFPEYYFAGAYLAIYIIVISLLFDISKYFESFGRIGLYILFAVILSLNIRSYSFGPSGFSLTIKNQIIDTLSVYPEPIDISYNFDPGRDGGLRYLINLKGVRVDPKSRTRILLTDKLNVPLYIDGELARDLTQIGNIRSAIYIKQ